MKIKSAFAKVAAILITLAMLVIPHPQPVMAGNNGQQVSVYICYATGFTITGYNQDSYQQQKSSKYVIADGSKCVQKKVEKWWWVGDISITAFFADTMQETRYYNIPQLQGGDWVDIQFRRDPKVEQGYMWIAQKVVYGIYFDQPDPNPNDNYYDAYARQYSGSKDKPPYYRTDCSGFISFAWNLDKSYDTTSWSLYAKKIKIDNLQPGDAIINDASSAAGHIVLFVQWINKSKGQFIAYEENTYPGRYAQNNFITITKTDDYFGTLKPTSSTDYHNYGGTFIAIRKDFPKR